MEGRFEWLERTDRGEFVFNKKIKIRINGKGSIEEEEEEEEEKKKKKKKKKKKRIGKYFGKDGKERKW